MSLAPVVQLIRSHRVRIARALVRQVRVLVPRYAQLDSSAQERNFIALLVAVERLLESGDDALLMEVTAQVAQLRASMGFQIEDFTAAALAFLPVMRRFLVEHSASAIKGLDEYEEFEALALPVLGRVGSVFLDADEDVTLPSSTKKEPRKKIAPGRLVPIRIERVSGSAEEEESTVSGGRLFSSIA